MAKSTPRRGSTGKGGKKTPLKGFDLSSTSDLVRDQANPRKITEAAAEGLSTSLDRFGDLSGIVFNSRTKELVAGHQRLKRIEDKWGKQEIKPIDESSGLFGIRIDADHFFAVRVVDWSRAKQRAANVAANNQRIAGDFTDDLDLYLLEFKDELEEEMGESILDDLLLLDLDEPDDTPDANVVNTFQILVQCDGEAEQESVYKKLKEIGLDCKVLTP